ncbi:hypothetical protein CHARACLAT_018099 [Characodon lateralis]|uniref:C3H1-type domain-containing protein n=1 Tax=Characodon lateralis TaxID=208331 RepID=A0ABU7F3X5_9TELE|nr:hypothetical protein [Characodon lateralis]
MTNHGDDCYFYYYSTCNKGDSCPFRHCEVAMGNETVCNLWQEGRCFRTVCKFRHMEITKNRKEIPCYWENQPAGCQKPHCAFFHERARYVEGIFVPPDKVQSINEEQVHEEPAPPSAAPPPNAANPQLRGVIKTETQEPVPSPTHPPVVINPADDDEDEEDQFSEEGEDGKVGPSPRKITKSGDSLNFGVSTLEEIRLRRALKSSMKKAGYPIQNAETSINGEKENIQSLYRPACSESGGPVVFEEHERPRGSVTERLGRRIPSADFKSREGITMKKSLAERLGSIVDKEHPSVNTQKALQPIKERLGLIPPVRAAEANADSTKAPEQIRIKTLEEIKQDKAAKTLSQKDAPVYVSTEVTKSDLATKVIKRSIAVTGHVKKFSEILRAKKRKQEEQQNQNPNLMKVEHLVENAPGKSQGTAEATNVEKVRVKTLEEIRREKSARLQAQQTLQAESKEGSDAENNTPKRRHLLLTKKLPTQSSNMTPERSAETAEKSLKTPAAPAETSTIKVKTFDEIMQEKRLRKQEMEGQVKSVAEADCSHNQSASGALKRKAPAKICLASSELSLPSATTPSRVPVRKLISLKPQAPSPPTSTSSPGPATLDPLKQSSPQQPTSHSRFMDILDKVTSSPLSQSSAKLKRESCQAAEAPVPDKSGESNQTKTPDHPVNSRVRPKLNVKPSVVKPAGQVKPGQKKSGAEGSGVAAVKPMNTTYKSSNKEAQLTSAVPPTPTSQREELHIGPVLTQIQGQDTKAATSVAAVRDTCPVLQSPVLKTPIQSKPRRSSIAASRTASTSNTDASGSSVDDFEELINQFTDDHLEEDVDPAIGEDDLLQELSEMIDS